ncbi:hypothetical protein AAMO2058_001711100 [Amorphochlora amoebiformis]
MAAVIAGLGFLLPLLPGHAFRLHAQHSIQGPSFIEETPLSPLSMNESHTSTINHKKRHYAVSFVESEVSLHGDHVVHGPAAVSEQNDAAGSASKVTMTRMPEKTVDFAQMNPMGIGVEKGVEKADDLRMIKATMLIVASTSWLIGLYYYLGLHKSFSKAQSLASDAERAGASAGSTILLDKPWRVEQSIFAIYNLVNMHVGMGFWVLPYSILIAGYPALIMLGVLLICCSISSSELANLHLYFRDQGTHGFASRISSGVSSHGRDPYIALAKASLGWKGEVIAWANIVGMFFGGTMVLILTVWDLVTRLLDSDITIVALVSCVMALPFLWFSDWKSLAYTNAFALVATVLAIGVMFASMARNPEKAVKNIAEASWFIKTPSVSRLAFAAGLQLVAVGSGAPTIPSILKEAENKDDFIRRVILPSMITVSAFGLIVAIAGVLTYGTETDFLITENLLSDKKFGLIVSSIIVAATFATIPPVVSMTAEPFCQIFINKSNMGDGISSSSPHDISKKGLPENESGLNEWSSRTIRYMLFAAIASLSYVARDYIGVVLEVTGLVCMSMSALILPLVMSLTVFWADRSPFTKVLYFGIISASVATICMYFATIQVKPTSELG